MTTESIKKQALQTLQSRKVDGKGLRIAIVHTQWNLPIVQSLLNGAKKELVAAGVSEQEIFTLQVSGAYELPYAVTRVLTYHKIDAVIAIGCLIKGSTMHFEYIAEAVSQGLMRVQLDSHIPVIFGVLTCLNEGQAKERAGMDNGKNHGCEWAQTAIEMARLRELTVNSKCPMRMKEKTPYSNLDSCPFFNVSAWLHVVTIAAIGVTTMALWKRQN